MLYNTKQFSLKKIKIKNREIKIRLFSSNITSKELVYLKKSKLTKKLTCVPLLILFLRK